MRSRRRGAQAIAWLLAAGLSLGAAVADAQSRDGLPDSRFVEQRERFAPGGGPPIDLRFVIAPEVAAQSARLVAATHATLTMASEWFGPFPLPSLTVAGLGWWPGDMPPVGPGVVAARLRWLTPARDQGTEREVIDGVVRQYWPGGAPPDTFARVLHAYIAARLTHHQLEGSNFATLRFFGGYVPFSLRSVLLSPPIADPRPRAFRFDEPAEADTGVARGVRAMQTIERYVGWPTMLEALSTMRLAGLPTEEALAAVLSDVRGTDMRSLVAECFRADAVFDYSLDGLQSQPGPAGVSETTVTITRRGSGRFAIGNGEGDAEAAMPMRVRFADGTEVRDYFDGAAPASTLIYSAKSEAVAATIDPDAMLLLDVNRANNAIVHDAPTSPLGIRLALNWMAWLQNAMLSYTALL